MSEIEQLATFCQELQAARLDATPDDDYSPEEDEALLDEMNDYWYASRGV